MAGAGSSRFAVTCELLRQYMREQQMQQPPVSFLATAEEAQEDARTMQLFPPRAADGASAHSALPASQLERPEAGTRAPLTIFYDGRVLVFDDFPAEKAMELMQLATTESSSPAPVAAKAAAPPLPPPPPPVQQMANPQPALSEMPIMRKASLKRFLEKRKQRITTSDPYQKAAAAASPAPEKGFAASKPVKDEPATWLGL